MLTRSRPSPKRVPGYIYNTQTHTCEKLKNIHHQYQQSEAAPGDRQTSTSPNSQSQPVIGRYLTSPSVRATPRTSFTLPAVIIWIGIFFEDHSISITRQGIRSILSLVSIKYKNVRVVVWKTFEWTSRPGTAVFTRLFSYPFSGRALFVPTSFQHSFFVYINVERPLV